MIPLMDKLLKGSKPHPSSDAAHQVTVSVEHIWEDLV